MSKVPLPTWEWPVAGVAHLVVFTVVAFAQCGSGDATPLFRAEDTIVVEMTGPPTEASRMPQKAERAPEVQKGAATPDAVKPPPNPSDLALPNAATQRGATEADARQALLDEVRRDQLLRDLDAPEGKIDRAATGDAGGTGGAAQAGLRDPELARWVKASNAALAKNFHPLPAWCAARPDIVATAAAVVDAAGRVAEEPVIVDPSGNASFDAACTRAYAVSAQLPALPAKYAAGLRGVLECTCN